MSFIIEDWLEALTAKIKNEFGDRVSFIGLQGSYRRNEANDSSDIDIVTILNELSIEDLERYRSIILNMPYKEKACGFISGKREIINWEKSDLFQFYHDTQPIYGSIEYLLPLIDKEDVKHAVKIGACNLYHACCHNFIYKKSSDILSDLYKLAFFVLQAKHFYETNCYISSKTEINKYVVGEDSKILNICMNRKKLTNMDEVELVFYYDKLISWSSKLIQLF